MQELQSNIHEMCHEFEGAAGHSVCGLGATRTPPVYQSDFVTKYGSRSGGEECGRGGTLRGVVGRGETKLMPRLKSHRCNQFSHSCAFHANVGLIRLSTTLQ